MSLLYLVIALVIAGAVLYVINGASFVDANVKKIINALVITVLVIVAIVWLAGFLGLDLHGPSRLR